MNRQRTALIIAITIALVAFVGLQQYLNTVRKYASETVTVWCVGQKALTIDSTSNGIELRDLSRTEVPRSVYEVVGDMIPYYQLDRKSLQPLLDPTTRSPIAADLLKDNLYHLRRSKSADGVTEVRELAPGTPLQWSRLERKGTPPEFLAELYDSIRGTRRAFSFQVDAPSLHGGLLQPGMYVDVLATMRNPDPSSETKIVTRFVVQRELVVALNGRLTSDNRENKGGQNLVTMSLPPDVCQGMELLDQMGARFSIVLRNSKDKDVNKETYARTVSMKSFFESGTTGAVSTQVFKNDPFYHHAEEKSPAPEAPGGRN